LDENTEISVRQNENDIFLTTTLLNSKVSTLQALASIHTANTQRASTGSISEDQARRMEKNEQLIDKLNDEIVELDRNVRGHFSAPGT
jgi:hypothetical protein